MPPAPTEIPLDDLCTSLRAEFRRDPRGRRVAGLLEEYARTHRDWQKWALFDPTDYTRNLVYRCGTYELLLLAWKEGQTSPIHDHAGQNCWMAVLDGEVEEVHFRSNAGGGPPIADAAPRVFRPGQVAYIADEIALHVVRPTQGGAAVSLHLYSNPIDSCRIYDPATGTVDRTEAGYHSVRGQLCGAKTPDAVRAEFV